MKYIYFLAGILFITPFVVNAADPSVASLTSGSASINSAQVASITWSVADSGGYSFVIPCSQGIKFKRTNGTVFPCDVPISSVLTSADSIDLNVWNLSGATKSFTARVTPKNASGVDFPYGRKDIQISVAPVTHPIESVTGATTSKSSAAYTLSWTGSLIDGVNISISCAPTIRTTSTSYAGGFLPCGTHLFPNGLPASGSINFIFDNSSASASDITINLIPMMAPGVYNGIQTESVTVSVDTNILPDPITTYFSASTTVDRTAEGTPVKFSWITENSTGANMRISCNDNIVTRINIASASSTPQCGNLAFGAPLTTSGSGTVTFSNKSFASEPITLTLMPMRRDGGFDATRGKDIFFRVLPKDAPAVIPSATPTAAVTQTPVATSQTQPPISTSVSSTKNTFTRNLVRGSYGAEVRALQIFLKKDPTIYPEGIVNGTFGPATERAVRRFQSKYKIGSVGTPGYGGVGPKTRALLNSLTK